VFPVSLVSSNARKAISDDITFQFHSGQQKAKGTVSSEN